MNAVSDKSSGASQWKRGASATRQAHNSVLQLDKQRHLHLRSQPNPKVRRDPIGTSSTLAYADVVDAGALAGSNGRHEIPAQGATLKNLCEEDKQKVARLIRQVVSVTKEKEAVQREAAQERASHQAALEGLQAQNRDLLAELTALRLKLLHADGLLRSYQLKLRQLKGGGFHNTALLPDSPTLRQPVQAAALPRPTSPNSLDGPGATSSASVGAFSRGTPSSHPVQAEPSQGGGLPASPSKRALNTNNPPARSGAPAVPGVLESARASVQHRLGSPPSAAAGVPAEGVWAAWAELEQRIRAISGELAQRGGQHGEDTVPSDGVAGARPQDGNATGGIAPEEAVARPASHVAGHAGEVRPTGGRARVASADMHSTEVACIRKEPNGSPSKHSEMGSAAANLLGSALAAEPPGRGEEPPGGRTEPVRVSSPHLPLVGGPVSQPRPVFFPSKEAPLTNPPSYPQGILPAPHPPAVMPTAGMLDGQVLPAVALPRVPAGPAPAPAPAHSRPPVSSIPGRSAVQAPVDPAAPLPGCSDSTHSGTVAPLLGVRSGLPEGALNGGQGAGPSTRSGDAPLVLGGAASAAEVSYDVAGTDQGRGLACSDGQAGPAGECDAAEVSGMPDRGEAVCERVLRFDPTVGEAGAFYYVDVLPVEEDRRAGDGISEKTGGQGTKGGARSKGAEDISRRARVVSPSGGPGHYGRRRAAGDAEFERSAPSSLPDEAVADGGPVAEVPLVFVSAAPRGAPRVVVKESGPRDRSTSPEGSRSRGGEPGLARWVSGMLYDSALLELVEELEMGHARASRHDAARDLPAEWTAWARRTDGEGMRGKPNGVSQALPNANGRGKVQAARGRRERHPHFAQSHAEPEVLVLANGW